VTLSSKPHHGLRVAVPLAQLEEISWVLVDLGATALESRDGTTMNITAAGKGELLACFEDLETRDRAHLELASAPGVDEVGDEEFEDDGWSTRWRDFHRPVVLERLEVIAPWMETTAAELETVVIDPGQAFGTGGHATTRLVLEMLERRVPLPGRVLDVGCGSGVLAIAAARLGAGHVLGVDIEDAAVEATRSNAALNGLVDRIDVVLGTAADAGGTWSLVLANLELGAFLEAAPGLTESVEPGGIMLLSGLLEEQVGSCLDLFDGFVLVEKFEREGWAALALERCK